MPLQIRRTTKRKPRLDKSPGRTCVSRQKRLSLKDSPGSDTPQHQLTTRPVPCTTNPGSPQLVYAGRYMMRLVTSCITGRRPQTPAGATCREPSTECMLTVSQPHVDLGLAQPIGERSPPYTRIYLCEFALMTNLSFRVFEEESQHTSSNRSWCNLPRT